MRAISCACGAGCVMISATTTWPGRALALSPDQTRLYVACSDADVVASVNVSDVRGVVELELERLAR